MKRQEIFKLIPFGIATLLVLISVIQVLMIPNTINDKGETVRYVVSDSILYASFGLIIVLIFIIQRKNYWKHAFGVLLIIALTPLIQFNSRTFSFGIGFIQFEITALGLLIFHLALNKEVLRDTLDFFKTSETEKEENKERQIESFQRKFASKDKNELERIVNENFLVPEAVEAAKRLLNEK
jgi:hypothetical protein